MAIRKNALAVVLTLAALIVFILWRSTRGAPFVEEGDDMKAIDAKPAMSSISEGGDEYLILVNREYVLASDYVPADLREVDIPFMALTHPERSLMRDEAAGALEKMFADAGREGIHLLGISGYRSYESQRTVYENGSTTGDTDRYIARPGASEHQTGLAMDIGCAGAERLSEEFAYTEEGQWVKENAHRYGFILRYPEDGEEVTGYGWEPWHIRYVGEAAADIDEQVLETFLRK